MINDEKRREIAGNLRYCAEMCNSTGVLDSDVLNALGIHCGDTDGVSSAYDVERLADLIDRKTCSMSDIGDDTEQIYRCSVCGAKYFMSDVKPYPWLFCPSCGAMVVRGYGE